MVAEETTIRRRGRFGRIVVGVLVLVVLLGRAVDLVLAVLGVFRGRARRRAAEVLAQGLDLQDLRGRAGAVRRGRRCAADLVLQHPRREARRSSSQPRSASRSGCTTPSIAACRLHCFAETPYFAESFTRACNAAERVTSARAARGDHDDDSATSKPARSRASPSRCATTRARCVLVVNTASKCGFTPQYQGLEELYRKYQDRGLVVLGFPCNQFLSQEPGGADEIGAFCERNYGVSFPMFEKIDVNGRSTHPLYRWLKQVAARRARHAADQMELHQVPARPQGQSRRALRAAHRAASTHEGYRGAVVRRRALLAYVRRRARAAGAGAAARKRSRCGNSGSASARSSSPTIAAPTRRSVYPVPVPYFVYRGRVPQGRSRRRARRAVRPRVRRAQPQRQCDDSGQQRGQRGAPRHAGSEADDRARAVARAAPVAFGGSRRRSSTW